MSSTHLDTQGSDGQLALPAWDFQGLPAAWPDDLPLPPESSILGHRQEGNHEPEAWRIGLESRMSPLGLAAYFDALTASAGFAECCVEISDELLACTARSALRSLRLSMWPGAEVLQGWLLLAKERNVLFNPRRSYLYIYGKRITDSFPPGFPSSLLCAMPGASLVFARQSGASAASLGQHTRVVSSLVQDFYHRHLSDCGFTPIQSAALLGQGQTAGVYGRRDETVRVEIHPFQGWLRVECHYSATGTTNIYDKGWR